MGVAIGCWIHFCWFCVCIIFLTSLISAPTQYLALALALAAITPMFQSCSPSHFRDERHWRVEFSTEAYNLLNALEQIGYKVITSSSFVTGHKKFDTKVRSVPIQGVPINWWCCRTTSGPCTDPPSVTLRCEAA